MRLEVVDGFRVATKKFFHAGNESLVSGTLHGERERELGDAMSIVQGYTTDNFFSLRDVFEEQLAKGEDVGASIAVMLRGELVADIWGGYTDETMTNPWQRDTILNVWSVTKTMTFLVALILSDRGELDFDAPVAKYWPEFAQRGKESIAVRHVMGHTSGLSAPESWRHKLRGGRRVRHRAITS